jgi:probable HAF family extracellular repeat protein
MCQCGLFSLILSAFLLLASGAPAAQLYHVTDLGDTGDGTSDQFAQAINASGEIVGGSRDSSAGGPTRAYLWKPTSPNATTGTIQSLNISNPGFESSAFGISDYGQVASDVGTQATLWTPSTPQGTSGSNITLVAGYTAGGDGVNNFGQVVGYVQPTFNSTDQGFVWTPNSQHGSLGMVTYLNDSILSAVNSMGQVTGSKLWTPTTPNGTTFTSSSFGVLPGFANGTHAYAINSAGQVAGFSQGTAGVHAVLWSPNTPNGTTGNLQDLGDFAGGINHSEANGMNDAGTVVGYGENASGPVGFIWTSTDGMLALNSLLDSSGAGWNIYNAQGINNAGQIVSLASYDPDGPGPLTGYTHGVLLTPVPEPGALLAATVSTTALLLHRRRRPRIG